MEKVPTLRSPLREKKNAAAPPLRRQTATVQDGSLARGFWLAGWLAGWLLPPAAWLVTGWLAVCLAADRPLAGRGVC